MISMRAVISSFDRSDDEVLRLTKPVPSVFGTRVEESHLGMRSQPKKMRGPSFPKSPKVEKSSTKQPLPYRPLYAPAVNHQQKGS
jgi:hypothetical protein